MSELIRGNQGFGRKAKPLKGALAVMSQYGPVTTHFYDPVTDETTLQTVHDVSAILEDNAEQRLSGHDGYSPSRELHKVASIPMGAIHDLMSQGIDIFDDNDWPKIAEMLDSKDWEKFRTSHGVISKRKISRIFVPCAARG